MAIKIQGDIVISDDEVFILGAGTTAERPVSPELGMIRFNTDLNSFEAYDGTEWGEIRGGISADISDTAPSDPDAGDLWWDSTSGTLKIYYDDGDSQQWVDASPTLSNDFTRDLIENPLPPDNLGEPFQGGIYMGTITAAGQCYALIVAPNATGCAQCQWKTTRTATAGTDSLVDGFANTYGPLDNADHPAGNWCATRTINGFSDWYLPAIDELEVFYNNGATGSNESVIGSGEAFASSAYWSSTESFVFFDPYGACRLSFNFGSRAGSSKTSSGRVRAVRREPI